MDEECILWRWSVKYVGGWGDVYSGAFEVCVCLAPYKGWSSAAVGLEDGTAAVFICWVVT